MNGSTTVFERATINLCLTQILIHEHNIGPIIGADIGDIEDYFCLGLFEHESQEDHYSNSDQDQNYEPDDGPASA